MNTRSNPCCLSSNTSCSAGSNARASTPARRKPASTALPESSEISRSADLPPRSTATLPSARTRSAANGALTALSPAPSCVLPDNAHLALQHHAELAPDRMLNVRHQRLDVGCGRRSSVDDEVGMFGGNHCAAERAALESTRFDQPRRIVSRRIAKYRSGIGLIERLRSDAPLQQFLDRAPRRFAVTALQSEPSGGEPFFCVRSEG